MKVIVDPDVCTGHGRCWTNASEVYTLDENGYNAVMGVTIDVSPDQEEAARLGARTCPERAITVIED